MGYKNNYPVKILPKQNSLNRSTKPSGFEAAQKRHLHSLPSRSDASAPLPLGIMEMEGNKEPQ